MSSYHPEFSLEGYKIFSQNIENQEGRGIIIYIENSLPAEEVNLNTSLKECIFVELKLINKRNLLFGCIYRSDSGSDENNEELINMIKTTLQLNYSHIITVGDFNLPDINWTTKSNNPNNLNFKFVECLKDAFKSQHVRPLVLSQNVRSLVGSQPEAEVQITQMFFI